MPSTRDSRQPYRLSNLDLVTESFTLMAGISRRPAACIWYRRCTPVVVSSETPFSSGSQRWKMPGVAAAIFFNRALTTSSSSDSDGVSTQSEPSSISYPRWISRVASPPSSTISCGPSPSGKFMAFHVQSQYSRSVSPFQAKTGVPDLAMAAAAWSWVEKMLQLAQRTEAPRAVSVSISTAVCTVMCREPMMRTPSRGLAAAYFSRTAIRPGISCSAISSSLRPKSARPISRTLYCSVSGRPGTFRPAVPRAVPD